MPPQAHSWRAEPSRGGAPAGAGAGLPPTTGQDPAGQAPGPRAGPDSRSTEEAVDGVRDGSGQTPAAEHGSVTKIARAEETAFPRWIARVWPAVALWSWHPLAADDPLTAGPAAPDGPEGEGPPREASFAPETAIGDSESSFADLVLPVAGGSLGERLTSPLAGYGPAGGVGLSFDFILLAVLTVLLFLLVFAPTPSAWPRWRH